MAEKKLEQVTVRGASDDRRVALWERHPQHPDGEAFVCNDGQIHTVARTAEVSRKIGEGALVEGGTATRQLGATVTTQPAPDAPPLREATQEEERSAGLTEPVEKETAKVPENRSRGNR